MPKTFKLIRCKNEVRSFALSQDNRINGRKYEHRNNSTGHIVQLFLGNILISEINKSHDEIGQMS